MPQRPAPTSPGPLLSVDGLSIRYRGQSTDAVHDVSFTLEAGDRLAIVGESGSGKSTLVQALLGLLPASAEIRSGTITFRGERVDGFDETRWRALRGRSIGLVPQDPLTNLDPLVPLGAQVAEGPRAHGVLRRRDSARAATEVLGSVHLPDPERQIRRYPHQLSGGMRQRVLIGIGIAGEPVLLLADEPTSALDVTVQRGILDLIDGLVDDQGLALLLVTHDLALAADRSSHLLVMRAGRVVEQGTSSVLLERPSAPYTRALLGAAPHHRTAAYGPSREGGAPTTTSGALLEVDHLIHRFGTGRSSTLAVDDVSFAIRGGETVALVGGSGSGKSTIANIVLGFQRPLGGTVRFDGVDVTGFASPRAAALRSRIQPIFQDPSGSLDPRFTVADAIAEPLVLSRVGRVERGRRVAELLDAVALPAGLAGRRVTDLSGGQKQRVAIARALAPRPSLLVSDEAVSALDVLVQEQILDLLGTIQRDLGLACLFITHDLSVARWISHRAIVLEGGRIQEQGDVRRVFDDPQHPMTRRLLEAIPGRAA